MIQLGLDQQSWEVLNRMAAAAGTWDEFMHKQTANDIAEAVKEYMKPLMSVRPVTTGSAEKNLRHEVNDTGNGFDINFFSNFYINFVDEGSPFTRIFAYTYGLWGFPIKTGDGGKIFRASISGVGQGNSPYADMLPTHFSQKASDFLQEKAADIAFQNLTQWISRAVG
jgi:hypothetical protein